MKKHDLNPSKLIDNYPPDKIEAYKRIEIGKRILNRPNYGIEPVTDIDKIQTVGGADVHYFCRKVDITEEIGCAAVVLCKKGEKYPIETAVGCYKIKFPYIPGLLGFREAPPIIAAFRKLRIKPDILFINGHGYAHPLRFGSAIIIGLALGIPTVGIAANRLVGKYNKNKIKTEGRYTPLTDDKGKILGYVLKPCKKCSEIFISKGYAIDEGTALKITANWLMGHKFPEPLYLAHRYAKMSVLKRKMGKGTPEIERI